MQGVISSILAVLFSLLSIGINIDLHYCLDEIKAIHLVQKVDDFECCGKPASGCEMSNTNEPTSSCCSHKQVYLKVNDFQASVSKEYFPSLISIPVIFLEKKIAVTNTAKPTYSFSPVSPVPLYLRENRLTLYG